MRIYKKIYEHVNIIYETVDKQKVTDYLTKNNYRFSYCGPIFKGKAKGKYRIRAKREI